MPCGEDWLSQPLGIVQGFFGEWRRWGRAGRAAEFAEPGPGPTRGCLGGSRGRDGSRACAGRRPDAPCPGPAAGASHLPDSRSPGGQGYGASSRRPAVIDGRAAPAAAPPGARAPRAAGLGEVPEPLRGPAEMGRRKGTLPVGSLQGISKLPVCRGSACSLARSRSWL